MGKVVNGFEVILSMPIRRNDNSKVNKTTQNHRI